MPEHGPSTSGPRPLAIPTRRNLAGAPKTCAVGATIVAAFASACAAAERNIGGGAPSVSGAADRVSTTSSPRSTIPRTNSSAAAARERPVTSALTRLITPRDPLAIESPRRARVDEAPRRTVRSSSRPVEATDESAGSEVAPGGGAASRTRGA